MSHFSLIQKHPKCIRHQLGTSDTYTEIHYKTNNFLARDSSLSHDDKPSLHDLPKCLSHPSDCAVLTTHRHRGVTLSWCLTSGRTSPEAKPEKLTPDNSESINTAYREHGAAENRGTALLTQNRRSRANVTTSWQVISAKIMTMSIRQDVMRVMHSWARWLKECLNENMLFIVVNTNIVNCWLKMRKRRLDYWIEW